jgi:hypothetical protein
MDCRTYNGFMGGIRPLTIGTPYVTLAWQSTPAETVVAAGMA